MVVEKVFAVIAESTRRDILEALAQESKAVGQLVDELGVSQPTVSKHLRVLREAGVVTMRAQGQKRFYAIETAPLALVSSWLESLGAGIADDGARPAKAPAAVAGSAAAAAKAAPDALAGQPGRQPAVVVSAGAAKATPSAPQPATVEEPAAKGGEGAAAAPVAAGRAAAAPSTGSELPAHVAAPELVRAAGARPASVQAAPQAAGQAAGRTSVQAPAHSAGTPANRGAATVPDKAVRGPQPVLASGADNDATAQGALSRSVGRAAKKGAGLLASLKRKKD
ncbi:DNA-binding transcriptional ArsR family regulator [Arthrobacter stackebrandtii]|uniref:DNA-binding transcriptional ArsR family regulator n=1 Tax=Arthrobacter stackebrandtii TaxID=272161 RepID=A0ABS4YUB6_9MICC|nr:metalloregulator ArsR/SmtB family transcription factor [Arthrobacter stackebrandtii]MBP2412381.1 DNA-binding transcriptional ArsR family regulator [Arthrobacter stackebrandtii]PYH02155.1 transcriptional regulator [Arthrobacter stackebrandtii]